MKRVTKQLRHAIDALALAHAGEHLPRRHKRELLRGNDAVAAAALTYHERGAASAPRQVALVARGGLAEGVLQYAMQTCAQIGAGLVVLSLGQVSSAEEVTAPHKGALRKAEIPFSLVDLPEAEEGALARFLADHPRLAFVIADGDGDARDLLERVRPELSVPLVLVAQPKQS